jgi:hypothetical protein
MLGEVVAILVALVFLGLFVDLPLHYLMQHIREARSRRRGSATSDPRTDPPHSVPSKGSGETSSSEKPA